jgi:hypothetical protein
VALIAYGQAAVDPLAAYLLGPPTAHPQPRMLAAEVLGAIGGARAAQALVRHCLPPPTAPTRPPATPGPVGYCEPWRTHWRGSGGSALRRSRC